MYKLSVNEIHYKLMFNAGMFTNYNGSATGCRGTWIAGASSGKLYPESMSPVTVLAEYAIR
jgi:hypothetical protein